MRHSTRGRPARFAIIAAITLSLVAASCADKKNEDPAAADTTVESSTDDTTVGNTTDSDTTDSDTTDSEDTPPTTAPAVTAPAASELAAVFGGKIVVAGESETANPWTPANMNCDSFCFMRARTIYDPLVVVGSDLELEPYLAESVVANDDSTEFTITIRQGITFHDGTALDAAAVMDNLNRTFGNLSVASQVKDLARNDDGTIKMEQVDEFTFTMYMGLDGDADSPLSWPLFPFYLGSQGGLIASPTWLAAVDAGADPTEAVGTGPFTFDSYAPGDKMVVKRNPNYWIDDENGQALPYLDEVEFRVIPDSLVRSKALESGEVDLISTSDAVVIGELANNDGFGFLDQDQFSETNHLLLNLTQPYLADQSVRCALTQAIDKEDLVNATSNGYADVSNQMFTIGQEGYLEGDNGTPPYDPAAAAAAIADWEAANGDLAINFSLTPSASNMAVANYLADAWGQAGVEVNIDQIEQSKLINNALFGDPSFDVFGWRAHGGMFVDNQYTWWTSSSAADPGELALNFGRLRDPVIDDLLAKSRSESDPDIRRGYAEDINRQFAEQCYLIPLSPAPWGVFYNTDLQNIGRSPLPDGAGLVLDGSGAPGQVWLTGVFVSE